MTWVEIAPPSFSTLRVPKKSVCLEQSRELRAEDAAVSAAEIDLERVLQSVLGGVGTLSPRELKALPGLIFDPTVATYHPEFAEKTLEIGGKSKSFWRRLMWAGSITTSLAQSLANWCLTLKRNLHFSAMSRASSLRVSVCASRARFGGSLRKHRIRKDVALAEEVGISDGYASFPRPVVIEQVAKKTRSLLRKKL